MGALFGTLAALCIGASDLFGRRVVVRRGAIVATVVMQAVGVVASLLLLTVIASEFVVGDVVIGLASGLGLGVGLWAYLSGLGVSSSAVVAPIVATMSAVVPFAYAATRGADVSGRAVVGALVALAGLVLVSSGGGRVANVAAGVKWSLLSGAGYGFGLSVIIDATEASGAWPAVAQRCGALVLIGVVAIRSGAGLPTGGVRLSGLAAGAFGALSTVCYLLGVQADATPAVVTASMFPAVTVVVGRVVYGDEVGRRQAVGVGVVLIGVVAVVAS